mgnify:CR=1 FL=1
MKAVKPFIKHLYRNNKGLTLIEAVVAIAMIGVVSVGITTLMFTLSKTTKMSEEVLKLNAIYRVVRENVVDSARNGTEIYGNAIKAEDVSTSQADLTVKDRSGAEYPEYKFDLYYSGDYAYGDPGKTVKRYKIVLKNRNNNVLSELFTEVYP